MPRGAKSFSIGTERESSLHETLKEAYAGKGGKTEVPLEGYICDCVTPYGEIIEIQTGSFGPLKEKIRCLSGKGPVRIVHPLVIRRRIEVYDTQGKLIRARKSPRKGSEWDLFKALIYAPDLPRLPGIRIELVLADVVERRTDDGKGSWRRKGLSISDRRIEEIRGRVLLEKPSDYKRFIPFKAGETFTVRSLAEKAGISPAIARKALYVLHHIKTVTRVGKEGRAFVYKKGRPKRAASPDG